MVTVRLFAAAAEAAGVDEATVEPGTTAQIATQLAGSAEGDLMRIWRQCALMVDGRRVDEDEVVLDGSTLDVLPPFAGG